MDALRRSIAEEEAATTPPKKDASALTARVRCCFPLRARRATSRTKAGRTVRRSSKKGGIMDKPALKRAPDPAVRSVPPYPDYIAPCLATDIGRPPSGNKWAHEIKLDGFRMQLHLRHGVVTIYSREGHDWTERYRSVADQAAQLTADHLVVDGEMVVLRNDGTSDFWELQKGPRPAHPRPRNLLRVRSALPKRRRPSAASVS